jgi:hypothetical protein
MTNEMEIGTEVWYRSAGNVFYAGRIVGYHDIHSTIWIDGEPRPDKYRMCAVEFCTGRDWQHQQLRGNSFAQTPRGFLTAAGDVRMHEGRPVFDYKGEGDHVAIPDRVMASTHEELYQWIEEKEAASCAA